VKTKSTKKEEQNKTSNNTFRILEFANYFVGRAPFKKRINYLLESISSLRRSLAGTVEKQNGGQKGHIS
jgi:hypothetical protein